MQSSMRPYTYNNRLRRVSLRSLVLFGTGVMTMVHLVTLFSYVFYAAVIGMLLYGCMLVTAQRNFRLDRDTVIYLSWYGALFAWILFSVLYTVNTINPDYVLKRCSVIFVLGYITAALLKGEKDFITLANGLITGTLIVIGSCIIHEGTRVGIGRIGQETVGSAVALSGIVLVGFICVVWMLIFKERYKVRNGILSAGMLAVIVLTGSRRALLISIMAAILLVLTNRKIKKSKRFIFIFIMLLFGCVFLYLMFTNEILYSLIGQRMESMILTMFRIGRATEDASMAERSIMKEHGYELFFQRPLFGYGVHGFAYEFYRHYGKLLFSHCGFVELLSCYGIFGFSIFYRIFIMFAGKCRRVFRNGTDLQILMMVYVILTFLCEVYTIAFITPQVVVMLTAGINTLKENTMAEKLKRKPDWIE